MFSVNHLANTEACLMPANSYECPPGPGNCYISVYKHLKSGRMRFLGGSPTSMAARVQACTPNLTRSPFEKKDLEQSVVARFEEQARKYPNGTAVRTPNVTLTYSALNQQANR